MFAALAGWHARRLDIADALKDAGTRSHRWHGRAATSPRDWSSRNWRSPSCCLSGRDSSAGASPHSSAQDAGFRREGLLTITLSNPQPRRGSGTAKSELADPTGSPRHARSTRNCSSACVRFPVWSKPAASTSSRWSVARVQRHVPHRPRGRSTGAAGEEPARHGAVLHGQRPDRQRGLPRREHRVLPRHGHSAGARPTVRRARWPDAPHVALISESLARARWPNEDPIGVRIQFGNIDGDMRVFTVVGIVGDVREGNLLTDPDPNRLCGVPSATALVVQLHLGPSDDRPADVARRRCAPAHSGPES